jgi:bifunctional non-homologous end joining protein LigD
LTPETASGRPSTWDEVEQCASGDAELGFAPADALTRLEASGDPFALVSSLRQRLPRP